MIATMSIKRSLFLSFILPPSYPAIARLLKYSFRTLSSSSSLSTMLSAVIRWTGIPSIINAVYVTPLLHRCSHRCKS